MADAYRTAKIKQNLAIINKILDNPSPDISPADYYQLQNQARFAEFQLVNEVNDTAEKDRDIELAQEIIDTIEALETFLKSMLITILAKQLINAITTPFPKPQ